LTNAIRTNIGTEPVHGHGVGALGLQAGIQVVQRRLVGDQQREPVGKPEAVLAHEGVGQVRVRIDPARHPVGLGVAARRGVHLEQAARRLQELGQPLGGRFAFAPGPGGVGPDADREGLAVQTRSVQRDIQVSHARRRQPQRVSSERRADERHGRPLPLRHELARGVHHHPAPVMRKARPIDGRFGQIDARAGFDGVDMQAEDAGGHGGDGSTSGECRREYKKCGAPDRPKETKKARD